MKKFEITVEDDGKKYIFTIVKQNIEQVNRKLYLDGVYGFVTRKRLVG